jgi:hypothetical protein
MSPLAYESFRRQTSNVRITRTIQMLSDEEVEAFFGLDERITHGIRALANADENTNLAYFLSSTRHICP